MPVSFLCIPPEMPASCAYGGPKETRQHEGLQHMIFGITFLLGLRTRMQDPFVSAAFWGPCCNWPKAGAGVLHPGGRAPTHHQPFGREGCQALGAGDYDDPVWVISF